MFRHSSLLQAVREKGNVFFRNPLSTLRARIAQSTPLLQERPYPIAEITKRMVRIRVKYEASADETEMQLLRGEYKFYTGKPVHLRDASVGDLVAMVSCSGFFGFWDTSLIDRILELLLGRMEELSTLELAQLAQDLPLVERSRSPQLRAVFKLLCANNCERLREDLSFEDHLDLIDRAVGNHCPLIFVTTLLELIDPFIPGYAAFLEESNTSNENGNEITSINNNNAEANAAVQFKSEGLLNILETVLLAQELFEKRMNVLSARTGGEAMVEKETARFEPLKLGLIRRLKQQLLSNAKDQMEGNFSSIAETYKKKNIHDSSENQTGSSTNTHKPGYLVRKETDTSMFPLMAPLTMVKTFHVLSSLHGRSSGNASSNNTSLDIFTAHKILEYFWTSSMLNKLSCGDCLELCLTYVETFGITKLFEEEFLIAVAQFHLIDSIAFLDVAELNNAFEFIALFALEASSSTTSNNRTRKNILNKHLLITSDFFDAALDHLILLKDVGGLASVWPTNFILNQLKSLSVIVTCLRREELRKEKNNNIPINSRDAVIKEFSDHHHHDDTNNNAMSDEATNSTIQYHRPKLQAAVKSLCGSLISTVNSNMSPQDCCVFLGVVATMDDYVLDSAVAAVIKRLVRNWNNNNNNNNYSTNEQNEVEVTSTQEIDQQQGDASVKTSRKLADLCFLNELTATEINDLLTLWTSIIDENNNFNKNNSNAKMTLNEGRKIRVHPLVQSLLVPALRHAQKRAMEMQLE